MPDEPRVARLEIRRSGRWTEIARAPVEYPGWSAHFRVERWDGARSADYRVRHGSSAMFEGTIRRDPRDRDETVVASLGCNSSRTKGPRPEMVQRLLQQNPDLLFFSGDQTYHHTSTPRASSSSGCVSRAHQDRPTICIPTITTRVTGICGEKKAAVRRSTEAPTAGICIRQRTNMVQRAQSWHLPDPIDPAPGAAGHRRVLTRLRVGGVDFAILEDRKFKTGPLGAIPPMGPRPDHIDDEKYDPGAIDLPGLQLLGERQLQFLREWTEDWTGAEIKCVLSQTAFCGAAHIHGTPDNRLLADLDSNGWPQSGRNAALRAIRRARAIHLCGDQHIAVIVKHGIDEHRDGPCAFTAPALVNTIYARWWHPKDEARHEPAAWQSVAMDRRLPRRSRQQNFGDGLRQSRRSGG
jgi:phosphodiesterase/alkaline phosphatase D-like protein